MNHHPLYYRRVIVFSAVLLLAFAVARSDTLHHALLDILSVAEDLMREYPRSGMAVFLVLAAFSSMLTFFSSMALIPVGVYVWGPVTTLILLWIGGFAGGAGGYWIARTLGRRIVKRLFPEAPLRRYEQAFGAKAKWTTILLFRLALQSEMPSYVLGLVRYPFARYVPIMILGEAPYVFLVVYLGETFLERNAGVFALVLILALVLTVVAFRALKREMDAAGATRP